MFYIISWIVVAAVIFICIKRSQVCLIPESFNWIGVKQTMKYRYIILLSRRFTKKLVTMF